MKNLKTIGIDLAKNTFQVCGVSNSSKVLFNKKIPRTSFIQFIETSNIAKDTWIAMEACGSAHQLGRDLQKLGFGEVHLIAAKFIKPFVKNQKNDANDALAICEAVRRPNMNFVQVKTVEQQNILALHRVREGLIKRRTALSNEIRGLLLEYGVTIPLGVNKINKSIYLVLDSNKITDSFKNILTDLYDDFKSVSTRVKNYDLELKRIFETNELCSRIKDLEGVGPIVATAIIGAVGDGSFFKNGRSFAAWLGLTPRQFSTGGRTILGRISKKGDSYIRKNLIHGCRSVVYRSEGKEDKKNKWINQKKATIGTNKTLVALANKNARIIWALLSTGNKYKLNYA